MKKVKVDKPTRIWFSADPELTLAIENMRKRYNVTRKEFLTGVLRSLFKLENPVATWVDSQVNKEGAN